MTQSMKPTIAPTGTTAIKRLALPDKTERSRTVRDVRHSSITALTRTSMASQC